MEMITEHDNYEHLAWSVGVRLRGNLDSIHTWAEQFGLGNDFKKVSAKLSEGTSFQDRKGANFTHKGHVPILLTRIKLPI